MGQMRIQSLNGSKTKGGLLTDGIKWNFTKFLVEVAQLVERQPSKQNVGGSIPSAPTKPLR